MFAWLRYIYGCFKHLTNKSGEESKLVQYLIDATKSGKRLKWEPVYIGDRYYSSRGIRHDYHYNRCMWQIEARNDYFKYELTFDMWMTRIANIVVYSYSPEFVRTRHYPERHIELAKHIVSMRRVPAKLREELFRVTFKKEYQVKDFVENHNNLVCQ